MKKTIACMVAFLLLLAACPVYAEEQAAAELGRYGILQGDPDGNLRLDDSISRAEFAKMIMTAKEAKTYAPVETAFSDVTETHWAAGYIAAAAESGILNGMGDGTFAPEAPVTHEQALKMVVCALGYGKVAEQLGGYPDGHFSVADTHGLTALFPKDAGAARRGEIALLLAAALDVPLAETKEMFYFGETGRLSSKPDTIVYNGEDGNPLRTFRTALEKSESE